MFTPDMKCNSLIYATQSPEPCWNRIPGTTEQSDLYANYLTYLQCSDEATKTREFFLDVANIFYARGSRSIGTRILSNVIESNSLDDPQSLR